ncbi:MAG: glycosyltransferase [Lachnospiraceae bacterium]|nr:glycosyltransferase [Lachnospiraceae bacterium]
MSAKGVPGRISFVIPCYRSEGTITRVVEEIRETVSERPEYDYEIICVNDCSPDGVWNVLLGLAREDKRIKLVNFAMNRGKHSAILAGHSFVTGQYVVDMDDDCQSPVNNLWVLLDLVRDDECDVATANYYEKKESAFKRFGSGVNKYTTAVMLEKPVELHIDNFLVMKRFVSDAILRYKNPYPFFEGLVFSVTRRVRVVMMEQRDRGDDNSTGYTFKKSLSLWLNGLTAFSVKPLRIASLMGMVFAAIGFLWGIIILLKKFVFHTIEVLGYTSLAAIMLFSTGVMMLMLGMLGEYIGRIYISLNNMAQYIITETVNIENDSDDQEEREER